MSKKMLIGNRLPWLVAVIAFTVVLAAGIAMYAKYSRAETILSGSLSLGDSGQEVTILQTFLASEPFVYPENIVSGYYGNLTAAAVGQFQCAMDIVCGGSPAINGYGRVGPRTLNAINQMARVVNGETVLDVRAPAMTDGSVSVTNTTATVSWTTNESARGRVLYGTAWPFLYATAPSVSDSVIDTTTSVTLMGLSPNTTYYYVRENTDPSGNVTLTLAKTLKTAP